MHREPPLTRTPSGPSFLPESTRPVETVYEGKYAKGKRLKKEREAA
jgi:hypothetical protein